jgi:hypothetical protein
VRCVCLRELRKVNIIHNLDHDQARAECDKLGLPFTHHDNVETLRGKLRRADLSDERPDEFGTAFTCGLDVTNCEFVLASISPQVIPLLDSDDSWGQEYVGETHASAIRVRDHHAQQVRKRHFLRHLYIKCITLPRQAQDKHRENSKKNGVFSQIPPSTLHEIVWWSVREAMEQQEEQQKVIAIYSDTLSAGETDVPPPTSQHEDIVHGEGTDVVVVVTTDSCADAQLLQAGTHRLRHQLQHASMHGALQPLAQTGRTLCVAQSWDLTELAAWLDRKRLRPVAWIIGAHHPRFHCATGLHAMTWLTAMSWIHVFLRWPQSVCSAGLLAVARGPWRTHGVLHVRGRCAWSSVRAVATGQH